MDRWLLTATEARHLHKDTGAESSVTGQVRRAGQPEGVWLDGRAGMSPGVLLVVDRRKGTFYGQPKKRDPNPVSYISQRRGPEAKFVEIIL